MRLPVQLFSPITTAMSILLGCVKNFGRSCIGFYFLLLWFQWTNRIPSSGNKETLMGALPILQKNQNQRACLENENLPANYMSDYSVLGLVVDRLDAVLRILKEKKSCRRRAIQKKRQPAVN